MSTQHTPGPWSFAHRKTAESMYATEVFCAKGGTIATFTWYPMPTTPKGVTGTYREGNARLCAAAPEMLEQLVMMRGLFRTLLAETADSFNSPSLVETRTAVLQRRADWVNDLITKATGGAS